VAEVYVKFDCSDIDIDIDTAHLARFALYPSSMPGHGRTYANCGPRSKKSSTAPAEGVSCARRSISRCPYRRQ
jgi:hypothetical protein